MGNTSINKLKNKVNNSLIVDEVKIEDGAIINFGDNNSVLNNILQKNYINTLFGKNSTYIEELSNNATTMTGLVEHKSFIDKILENNSGLQDLVSNKIYTGALSNNIIKIAALDESKSSFENMLLQNSSFSNQIKYPGMLKNLNLGIGINDHFDKPITLNPNSSIVLNANNSISIEQDNKYKNSQKKKEIVKMIDKLSDKYSLNLDNFDKALISKPNQAMNLMIGINGSGKTRFLKLLCDIYNEQMTEYKVIKIDHLGFNVLNKNDRAKVDNKELVGIENGSNTNYIDLVEKLIDGANELIFTVMLEGIYLARKQGTLIGKGKIKVLNEFLEPFIGVKVAESLDLREIKFLKSAQEITFEEMLEQFSPGESKLFYLAILLFLNPNINNEKTILILDEPENHLHIRAFKQLIELIQKNFDKCTIWIASHSIILPHIVGFNNTFLIHNGEIQSKNSQLFSEIYKTLISDDLNDILFELINSPKKWNYYKFIKECFEEADNVTKIRESDPQFQQLRKIILNMKKSKSKLKLLDYGGGWGRLGRSIEAFPIDGFTMNKDVDYSICDDHYKGKRFNVDYHSVEKLYKENNKFDIIILSNVIHEVPILEWKDIFSNIKSFLNDDGYLVFMEAKNLAKGEDPTGAGFLLLDEMAVEILFDLKLSKLWRKEIDDYGKSYCYLIPKKELKNIDNARIKTTMEQLRKNVKLKLLEFKVNGENETKLYAQNLELFANIDFAIDKLNDTCAN